MEQCGKVAAICCGACTIVILLLGFVVGLFIYVIWGSIILNNTKELKFEDPPFCPPGDRVHIIWWYVLYCVLITMFEIIYAFYSIVSTCIKQRKAVEDVENQDEMDPKTVQEAFDNIKISTLSKIIGTIEFSLTLIALIWGWIEYFSLLDDVSCGQTFEDTYHSLYLFFFSTIIIQSIFFALLAIPTLISLGLYIYFKVLQLTDGDDDEYVTIN